MTRKSKLHEVRDYVIIALAMLIGSIGLNVFLLPNHITMGGIGGIASILCWGFGIPKPQLLPAFERKKQPACGLFSASKP